MAKATNNSPSLQKLATQHTTVRIIVVCVTFLIGLAMVLYAVKSIYRTEPTEPPWVTLLLAIFGPTGTIVVILAFYLRSLQAKQANLNKLVTDIIEGKKK